MAALVAGGLYYRAHQSQPLTDKDTIVVANFDNKTDDSVFDDTLTTALTLALRQSPFLNILSGNQLANTLKEMTRPANTTLTPEIAQEVWLRSNSKAYITGSIGNLGNEYVLGLRAVNCHSGETLAEEQATAASKEKVVDSLGQAASKLRGELGESLASVQKFDIPLAEVTTNSLDALKAYSVAARVEYEDGAPRALPHYRRAVDLDPNFAMAYTAAALVYAYVGQQVRTREYQTKAFQLRDHTSEREKFSIDAAYCSNVTGELEKAAEAYRELIEIYPRDVSAYQQLATVYSKLGHYDKGMKLVEKRGELEPHKAFQQQYFLALQRVDEFRRIVHELPQNELDQISTTCTALHSLREILQGWRNNCASTTAV